MDKDKNKPLELLKEVNNRFVTACIFHREQRDLFCFLAMNGFEEWHNFQYVSESREQLLVKKFIIEHYVVAPQDEIPESANVLAPLIGTKRRTKLKSDQRWSIVKQSWESYLRWEKDTLAVYSSVAKELFDFGDIVAYNFISEIVGDVNEEIAEVTNTLLDMIGYDWDLSQISAVQDTIAEMRIFMLRELYKNY